MPEKINPDDIKVTASTTGADGEGDGTGPEGQDPEGQEPETTEGDGANTTDGDGGSGPQDGTDETETDVDKLQAEIKRLRRENAKTRTGAKEQAAKEARDAALAEAEQARMKAVEDAKAEIAKAVQKALGITSDEAEELTPDQVIEKITKERDEEKAAREQERSERLDLLREVAVQDAAAMHDARPDRLLDSRSFMRTIRGLDTDGAGFRAAVAEAVKAAVEADSDLKATRRPAPPPVSGGTTVAGSPTKDLTSMSVEELMEAKIHKRGF